MTGQGHCFYLRTSQYQMVGLMLCYGPQVHGSAPDIAGQDIANPMAMVLSAAMMCRYGLDLPKARCWLVKLRLLGVNMSSTLSHVFALSPAQRAVYSDRACALACVGCGPPGICCDGGFGCRVQDRRPDVARHAADWLLRARRRVAAAY